MSQRKPTDPGHTRRAVLRTLGIGLPASALAATGCPSATNPPEPIPQPVPTGDTGHSGDTGGVDSSPVDTGTPFVADERTPEPTEPWSGIGSDDRTAFPLGVQTGDPGADRIVAWAWAPGAKQLTLHIALWDGSAWQEQPSIEVTAGPEGYTHHTITGLPSDQPLAVQFVHGTASSAIGHARTAPAADSYPEVRLGATSCTDQAHGDFPSLDELRALGPLDGMLWLGDTVYADGNVIVDDYRTLWREQLSKSSFQDLFAVVPGIWAWDDHEVGNNWSPQDIDPAHLEAAVTAFHETVSLPDEVRSTRQLWRRLTFGQTVELFVLDCRGERDFDQGEYVSPQQLQWLIDGLLTSTAVWKVVVTSVPITDMPALWDIAEAHLDRWDGYPGTQRAELLGNIRAEGVTGVFFVAGDLHQSTLSYVDLPGGDGDNLLEIMAGPGGSFRNAIARTIEGDQFVYKEADWSAVRLDFHPNGTARIRMVYEEGGDLMLDMVIDDKGQVVRIDQERHPWREYTTTP